MIKIDTSGWFWGILQLILITLKLLNKITWSWIWVFAPIWGVFLFALFVITIYIIVMIIVSCVDMFLESRKGKKK